jgi:hypothetical protein
VTIFYCLRFETPPSLEGQDPVFISPTNRVAQLYSQALGSLFVASYDSQCLHAGWLPELIESESESYVTTDSKSASLSWNEAPIRGLRPDIY